MTRADWEYIYTPLVTNLLDRYYAHLNGIISYSNLYDEIPVIWLEALTILNSERPAAIEAKNRVKKGTGGKNA